MPAEREDVLLRQQREQREDLERRSSGAGLGRMAAPADYVAGDPNTELHADMLVEDTTNNTTVEPVTDIGRAAQQSGGAAAAGARGAAVGAPVATPTGGAAGGAGGAV